MHFSRQKSHIREKTRKYNLCPASQIRSVQMWNPSEDLGRNDHNDVTALKWRVFHFAERWSEVNRPTDAKKCVLHNCLIVCMWMDQTNITHVAVVCCEKFCQKYIFAIARSDIWYSKNRYFLFDSKRLPVWFESECLSIIISRSWQAGWNGKNIMWTVWSHFSILYFQHVASSKQPLHASGL